MSLWRIAWRSLEQRKLASGLTSLSMALGVALVVAVLLVLGVVSKAFHAGADLGYNIVVGHKGSGLELVLNTVYYIRAPIGNIPYSYYQDLKTGRLQKYAEAAVPVCLGDYFENTDFRVIGTTPDFFSQLPRGGVIKFASGQCFTTEWSKSNVFSAVVGATVARQSQVKVGDTFQPSHSAPGAESHKHDPFTIVGILAPTGTPVDRAVFINIEGFYLLDNHAKPVSETPVKPAGLTTAAAKPESAAHDHADHDEADHDHDHVDHDHAQAKPAEETHDHADHDHDHADHDADHDHDDADHDHDHEEGEHHHHHHFDKPLPDAQREVTAILVRTDSMGGVLGPPLRKLINEEPVAQATMPVGEIDNLLKLFVEPTQWILLALAVLVVIVAGTGILVSIYNSMNDRRREIAILRSLGASRAAVMSVVLLESIMLSLLGGGVGWLLGHLLVAGLNPWIMAQTGVSISFWQMAGFNLNCLGQVWHIPYEAVIVPGLVLLAGLVGFLPALMAYRTDVSKSLSASP